MNTSSHSRMRQSGAILLMALAFSGIMLITLASLVGYVTVGTRAQRYDVASAQALALAEAGIDKAIYELNQNGGYTGETNSSLPEGVFITGVTTIDSVTKRITSTGYVSSTTNPIAVRVVKVNVAINTDVIAFQFGVQAGEGGVNMQNSSSIEGNLYSTGPVTGTGNVIGGDAISSGPTGLLSGIHATSSGYAHTITNSTIDKDAYYQSISGTTVGGTSYPNSADQPIAPLPISDAQIAEWEASAEAGGIISSPCPYEIESPTTLGPKKIQCDLKIKGEELTLTGPLWVSGNITIENSSTIKVDSSLGGTGVAVIADKQSNRTTSSKILLQNSTVFQGSGSPGSYVLFVSQNRSAEDGGGETAIRIQNSAQGSVLLYAGHGKITLENNTSLKEVTAWRITLQNSAKVIYETGLGSALFSSGPGGSWAFVPGTYAITD